MIYSMSISDHRFQVDESEFEKFPEVRFDGRHGGVH
jgi:hypothetical protein